MTPTITRRFSFSALLVALITWISTRIAQAQNPASTTAAGDQLRISPLTVTPENPGVPPDMQLLAMAGNRVYQVRLGAGLTVAVSSTEPVLVLSSSSAPTTPARTFTPEIPVTLQPNGTYTANNVPLGVPLVYRNGFRQKEGLDYVVTITVTPSGPNLVVTPLRSGQPALWNPEDLVVVDIA